MAPFFCDIVCLLDHSHDIIRDLSVYPDGCCDDSPLIVEKNVKHKCEDMKPTEEVEKSGRDKEGKNAVVVSEVLVDNGPLDLKHKVDASIAVQVITGPSEKRSKLSYCRTCPKTFSSRKELLKHSATAHADNRGQKICKICNRSCRSQNALVVHMRTHTQDRPFKCAKCEKAFKFVDNYKRHLASHSDDRPYECAKCGVRFKLQESLVKHERNLHAESDDSNLCDLCGKSFPRKTQLYWHRRSKHSNVKNFQCSICEMAFISGSGLQDHMRKHTGERPYVCDICGHAVAQRGNLNRHMLLHTGQRPHRCDFPGCDAAFTTAFRLKHHQTLHTGEKNHVCKFCGKLFRCRTQMVRHERLHTGEKPYKCDVCGKEFASGGNFREHKFTHMPEKPYPCQMCGASFMRRKQLDSHLCNFHGSRPDMLTGDERTS